MEYTMQRRRVVFPRSKATTIEVAMEAEQDMTLYLVEAVWFDEAEVSNLGDSVQRCWYASQAANRPPGRRLGFPDPPLRDLDVYCSTPIYRGRQTHSVVVKPRYYRTVGSNATQESDSKV